MNSELSLILLILAAAGAMTAVAIGVIALVSARRLASRPEETVLQKQIPASLDSLRLELRASLDGTTQTLNQRIAQLSADVDRRLTEMGGDVGRRLETTSGMIGARLEGAARAVAEVHEKLGTVQGVTERVFAVGKEIASLQQILRAPKLRGGLGELLLEELLRQVLPSGAFELQYGFQGGQRVDAVVRIADRLVPIDAKFPLENFSRLTAAEDEAARSQARKSFAADVKRRIDEVAERYIRPGEKTFDFALMYVPAENVYYETIIRAGDGGATIQDYALRKRVIPVSPNTLYAYLQVIVLGLRGLRIEERAQEILGSLRGVAGDLERFRQEFQVLGRHLEDASKKYGEAGRRLQRLEDSLERLEALGGREEERPASA